MFDSIMISSSTASDPLLKGDCRKRLGWNKTSLEIMVTLIICTKNLCL